MVHHYFYSMPPLRRINWKKPVLAVGCVSTVSGLQLLTKHQPRADLIELRYDTLHSAGIGPDEVIRHLSKRQNPVLLTLRTKREGGSHSWKSTERILLFEQLIPHVEAVDIELQNLHLLQPVLKMARTRNKGIILSAHSVHRKLTLGKALRWISLFRKHRVNAYKISALAKTRQDLAVQARLLLDFPKLRLGIMAMGPMASLSRQVLPLLGSKLVYGYLDFPAAKNQPSLRAVASHLER